MLPPVHESGPVDKKDTKNVKISNGKAQVGGTPMCLTQQLKAAICRSMKLKHVCQSVYTLLNVIAFSTLMIFVEGRW